MSKFHNKQFPGESVEYREKQDELLQAESDLRRNLESVAELRRSLPFGGKLKEDYLYQKIDLDSSDKDKVKQTRFSELFVNGKDSIIIYSFMFAPDAEKPCPMCTSLPDGLNGNIPHVQQRVNFVVVAKAPIQKIKSWAEQRGWNNFRLLSSGNNSYNKDYFTETEDANQLPALNVFRKTKDGIYHFYNTELLYTAYDEGQSAGHVDLIWPLWNLFDFTPEGRGTN